MYHGILGRDDVYMTWKIKEKTCQLPENAYKQQSDNS